MPWFTALFRNSTLAGSMKMLVNGSSPLLTRNSTTALAPLLKAFTTGPITSMPKMARAAATMPAEKLSISISKPGLTRPSQTLSSFFMIHAVSGPMIMAPMNMGMSVPTITPIVATAPTTPPRTPWTIRPPVKPIRRGRR
ncbi:hypothetical protein D9M72_567280 [compost metagenome]